MDLSGKKPSLVLNAVSNWCALVTNVVVGLLLTPFIIRHLGQDGYGIWTLVISIVGYSGILDLGVRSALTRYVSIYHAQKDNNALEVLVSTALLASFAAGAVCVVCSIVFEYRLQLFFRISPAQANGFHRAFLMIGIAAGIGFPTNVLKSVFLGRERFVLVNIVTTLLTITRAVLLLYTLSIGRGIVGLSIATLVVAAAEAVVFTCMWIWSRERVRIGVGKIQTWMVRQLLGYGAATTVISISDELRFNLDSAVTARFVDVASVAVYRVASIIVRYALNAIVATNSVLMPRFSNLAGKGKSTELNLLFVQSLIVSSVLSFGGGLAVLVISGPFIRVWVGDTFLSAQYVLWILLAAFVFDTCQNPSVGLLYALNKHRFYAVVNVIEGLANLAISVLLAKRYGVLGVAAGTAIPMLIVKLAIQPVYVAKIAGISTKLYYKAAMSPGLLAIIAFALLWKTGILVYLMQLPFVYALAVTVGIVAIYVAGTELLLRIIKLPSLLSFRVSRANNP